MTLYLKYRPQTIDDLDLEDVRNELKKIVKSGNIPHAFLFAGPKGTGKTSAARIIAKIVNCTKRKKEQIEPCNKCIQCTSITKGENIDVVELDAASHRGIDDIRSLRDAVKLAPASAKRKVYIIDEAHMLTTEASNALLKTLEEPPEHVMFILATTNPEKLIETIRSRTVLIRFQKAKDDEILRSLKKKVEGEKLKVEEGALEAIAKASDFSFRDADKILEQLSVSGKVSQKDARNYLFKSGIFNSDDFLEILKDADTKSALDMVKQTINSGGSAKSMLESILERLRSALLFKVGAGGEDFKDLEKGETINLIKVFSKALSQASVSYLEQLPFEVAIIEWCGKNMKEVGERDNSDSTEDKKGLKKNADKQVKLKRQKKFEESVGPVQSAVNENGLDDDLWKRILSEVRPENTSTEALLRASRPLNYDNGRLTLGVFYNFHKEKLETNPHRDILEKVSSTILGTSVRLICKLTKPPEKTKIENKDSSNLKKDGNVTLTTEGAASGSDSILTEAEDEDIINVAKEIFGG